MSNHDNQAQYQRKLTAGLQAGARGEPTGRNPGKPAEDSCAVKASTYTILAGHEREQRRRKPGKADAAYC